MNVRVSAALLLPALAFAQTRSRIAAGFESITPEHLRANLTYLASPKMEGRLSLHPGSERAAQWIAGEFAKAGLKPPANGTYFQKVPLIEFRTDREASSLVVTASGKAQTLHFPDAYGSFPNGGDFAGPVVFAGFGITAPELGYDDYAALDASRKVVLIFDHEPQENDPKSIFDGSGNTRYAIPRMKILNAQKHGAVAVLLAAEPNRKHPSNQERMARIPGIEQRQTRIASQAIEDDEVRIPLFTVSDKVAADLLSAAGRTPSALQSAIDQDLHPQSMPLAGASAAFHIVNKERHTGVASNVVGLIEGTDPNLKADTIIFSAHYDHDGPAAGGKLYYGADDNGSGATAVIELAQAFAANKVKPRRSLLFAAFVAEERGLLGSYYYVQHPLRPLETTRAVLNFDMVGRNQAPSEQTKGLIEIAADTSNELNLVGTKYSPDYKAAVEQNNLLLNLTLNYKLDDDAVLNVFFRSDQFPFAVRGIPAVRWFTGFHPDYHQVTDTVDKINFDKLAKIVRLAFLTGWTFADQQDPPKFVANPAAGSLRGTPASR